MDADIVFDGKAMVKQSGAGLLYDLMGQFSYFWGWTDADFLRVPIRRRKKLEKVISFQIKELFPKDQGRIMGTRKPGKHR